MRSASSARWRDNCPGAGLRRGLRAMYFLLANVAKRFSMLKYGLAIILIFIGVKMLLLDVVHLPVGYSLGVVASILALTLIIPVLSRPQILKTLNSLKLVDPKNKIKIIRKSFPKRIFFSPTLGSRRVYPH